MTRVISALFAFIVLFVSNGFAEDIKFAVIGDYGNNSYAEAKVARVLKEYHPQFVITTGDNNYPKGCWSYIDKHIGQYYHKYIGSYKGSYGEGASDNRFFPSLGNHDWAASESCLHHGSLPYLKYFPALPGNHRYYDFQKGSVHFFALDSDYREPDGTTIGSTQYQWFKQKIKNSNAKFKVVYFHHPPYTSGRHGPTKEMRWDFAAMGVDLVLAGHDHTYERIERDGIVYIVNGAGGGGLYSMAKKDEGSVRFYNHHHGFMLIQANDAQMLIQFINSRKKVRDERVIQAKKS